MAGGGLSADTGTGADESERGRHVRTLAQSTEPGNAGPATYALVAPREVSASGGTARR